MRLKEIDVGSEEKLVFSWVVESEMCSKQNKTRGREENAPSINAFASLKTRFSTWTRCSGRSTVSA